MLYTSDNFDYYEKVFRYFYSSNNKKYKNNCLSNKNKFNNKFEETCKIKIIGVYQYKPYNPNEVKLFNNLINNLFKNIYLHD